eukprot:gene1072-412_t
MEYQEEGYFDYELFQNLAHALENAEEIQRQTRRYAAEKDTCSALLYLDPLDQLVGTLQGVTHSGFFTLTSDDATFINNLADALKKLPRGLILFPKFKLNQFCMLNQCIQKLREDQNMKFQKIPLKN